MRSFLQFLKQIRKSQKSQYSMCKKPKMKSVLNLFSAKLEKQKIFFNIFKEEKLKVSIFH